MNHTVIFVASGFSQDNIRLQPWRYVYELAKHKSKTGNVFIITEGATDYSETDIGEHLKIINTRSLSVTRQSALKDLIIPLAPAELWWSTTQRSIAYYPLLSSVHCRKFAFITCPIYKWRELARAALSGIPYEQTKALWSQRLVPRFAFKTFLNLGIFERIVVQSNNNKTVLQQSGVDIDKIRLLPVGIDDDEKPIDQEILNQVGNNLNKSKDEIIFLYLGSLKPIRGFDALLDIFPKVVRQNRNARLVVLARGASQQQCDDIMDKLKSTGTDRNIMMVEGWLTKEQVMSYIQLSDVVTLPFVLVPSDIPVAALEALARGKPVVASSVDGLPELVKDRGVIIDPLNSQEFAEELCNLSKDKQRIEHYANSASSFIENYPRWHDVGHMMDEMCDAGMQDI